MALDKSGEALRHINEVFGYNTNKLKTWFNRGDDLPSYDDMYETELKTLPMYIDRGVTSDRFSCYDKICRAVFDKNEGVDTYRIAGENEIYDKKLTKDVIDFESISFELKDIEAYNNEVLSKNDIKDEYPGSIKYAEAETDFLPAYGAYTLPDYFDKIHTPLVSVKFKAKIRPGTNGTYTFTDRNRYTYCWIPALKNSPVDGSEDSTLYKRVFMLYKYKIEPYVTYSSDGNEITDIGFSLKYKEPLYGEFVDRITFDVEEESVHKIHFYTGYLTDREKQDFVYHVQFFKRKNNVSSDDSYTKENFMFSFEFYGNGLKRMYSAVDNNLRPISTSVVPDGGHVTITFNYDEKIIKRDYFECGAWGINSETGTYCKPKEFFCHASKEDDTEDNKKWMLCVHQLGVFDPTIQTQYGFKNSLLPLNGGEFLFTFKNSSSEYNNNMGPVTKYSLIYRNTQALFDKRNFKVENPGYAYVSSTKILNKNPFIDYILDGILNDTPLEAPESEIPSGLTTLYETPSAGWYVSHRKYINLVGKKISSDDAININNPLGIPINDIENEDERQFVRDSYNKIILPGEVRVIDDKYDYYVSKNSNAKGKIGWDEYLDTNQLAFTSGFDRTDGLTDFEILTNAMFKFRSKKITLESYPYALAAEHIGINLTNISSWVGDSPFPDNKTLLQGGDYIYFTARTGATHTIGKNVYKELKYYSQDGAIIDYTKSSIDGNTLRYTDFNNFSDFIITNRLTTATGHLSINETSYYDKISEGGSEYASVFIDSNKDIPDSELKTTLLILRHNNMPGEEDWEGTISTEGWTSDVKLQYKDSNGVWKDVVGEDYDMSNNVHMSVSNDEFSSHKYPSGYAQTCDGYTMKLNVSTISDYLKAYNEEHFGNNDGQYEYFVTLKVSIYYE